MSLILLLSNKGLQGKSISVLQKSKERDNQLKKTKYE